MPSFPSFLALIPVPAAELGIPVWLEITAMSASGFFGAILAAQRRAPIMGIIIGGLIVGLGGGIVRDLLLNLMPAAISQPYLIPAVALASFFGGLCAGFFERSHILIVLVQALSLGLLVVIGVEKAMLCHVSVWAVIAMGLITASAGGAMLDALSGMRSALLSQGRWHITSLIMGAVGFLLLSHFAPAWVAESGTVLIVVLLRLLSWHHGWPCPEFPAPRTPPADS